MSDSASWWTAACQISLCSAITRSLLQFMSTDQVMLSNHLPLLPSSPFNLRSFPSGHFQWVAGITINNSFPTSSYNNNKELFRLWLPLLHYPKCGAALPNGCYKHNWAVSTRCCWPPGQKATSSSPPPWELETPCFLVRFWQVLLSFTASSSSDQFTLRLFLP